MADYYYEVSPAAIKLLGGNKYYVASARGGHDAMMAGGFSLTMNSQRIWREDSSGIRFVKNRFQALGDPVDLKEFMWIKLKAETVHG